MLPKRLHVVYAAVVHNQKNKMNKTRAIRQSFKDAVGEARYKLMKEAIDRVLKSQKEGYYLEAITILESLIADRLESALSDSENNRIGFWTLEKLIRTSEYSINLDSQLKNIIINDLKNWKDKRNKALHEMVKLEENNLHDWSTRYAEFQIAVDNGYEIFKQLNKRIKELR